MKSVSFIVSVFFGVKGWVRNKSIIKKIKFELLNYNIFL